MFLLRIFAVLFGVILIFVGIAGYLNQFMIDGLLFGLFEVNGTHNIIHIVTGVFAIMAATSYYYTRLFFQIFGVVYTLIAILGVLLSGDLYIIHVNTADNVLHLVIGLVSLILGFFIKPKPSY